MSYLRGSKLTTQVMEVIIQAILDEGRYLMSIKCYISDKLQGSGRKIRDL